jgi:GntR family transcriptional regulator
MSRPAAAAGKRPSWLFGGSLAHSRGRLIAPSRSGSEEKEENVSVRLVDRSSPRKYYLQLVEILGTVIRSGELQEGDRLPTEEELCRQHSVSRAVIRAAMQELARQGLVLKIPGKGTFVQRARHGDGITLKSILTEQILDYGLEWTTDVVQKMMVSPPSDIASLFSTEKAGEVFKVTRLRSVEKHPAVLETAYVSTELCPGLALEDLRTGSIFDLLVGRYGVPIARTAESFAVTTLEEYEAKLLRSQVGNIALLMDRIIYTTGDRVAAFVRVLNGSEDYRITIQSFHT